jgi:hypothetical protein
MPTDQRQVTPTHRGVVYQVRKDLAAIALEMVDKEGEPRSIKRASEAGAAHSKTNQWEVPLDRDCCSPWR